ncbi:MAG: CBS domain-containing protein [Betaproteobacteria bacterium]|nr:CBS domain-containing protein [Betaproteobacteria bacterium]
MFSLYGLSGQHFRGTLEQLSELTGVTRARSGRAIGQEGEEALPTFVERTQNRDTGGQTAGYEAAARAYQETLQAPEQDRGPLYHAYQIMSRAVFTLSAEEQTAAAWRRLLARGVRQAPVLDAGGKLVGLVTERDLLITFDLQRKHGRMPLVRHVGEVMLTPVITADPVTDIRRIARVLLDDDLPGVPVVNDDGTLVGFVSRGDLLRAVVADPPLSLWT